MSTTVEISRDVVKELEICLESKLANAEQEFEAISQRIAFLKKSLAEVRAKLAGVNEMPLANGENHRQRLPKGHGDELIVELLKTLPEGQGLTMAEIKRRTGVNHSTIFRTLKEPHRNKGRFVGIGNEWSLKKKEK